MTSAVPGLPTRAAIALATMVALGVSGCAVESEPHPTITTSEFELELGAPGDQIRKLEDVSFYLACPDTPLTLDGTTWFPFTPQDLTDFPNPLASPRSEAGGDVEVHWARASAARSVGAAAPPGPGDQVGTLIEFEGGFAYWRSESGDRETWMTTQPIQYMWTC